MSELDLFEARFVAAYRRYLDEVPTDVDAADVARAVAAAHPVRRAFGWTLELRPSRALVWIAILGLLLVALATALLVGALRQAQRDPLALSPSGIEVMSPDDGAYNRVVADGSGNLWGGDTGGVIRYSLATGEAQTWSVADDARLGPMQDITPARAGGVWLVGGQWLRRFDGIAFRESVDVGAAVTSAAEASDGSLWAATADGRLARVRGGAVTVVAGPGNGISDSTAIAVDEAGRVWCEESNGWVSYYDGARWVRIDAQAAAPLGGSVWSITALPGGSVVVTGDLGVARFDGTSWTDLTAGGAPHDATAATLAPDGSLWVAGADQTGGEVAVGHLLAGGWATYGATDGLPGPGPVMIPLSIVATNAGVFVATADGVYRLDNGRWVRAWPVASGSAWDAPDVLAAVSRDEAWARSYAHLWHVSGASWDTVPLPENGTIKDLRRTADGTLWATVIATDGGAGRAFRLTADGWVRVADGPGAIGVDPSGAVLVAGTTKPSADIVVRSYISVAGAWTEQSATQPTQLATGSLSGVAIGGDGTVWLGSAGTSGFSLGSPGLARYRDGRWELAWPRGVGSTFAVWDLLTTRDGTVWVLGLDSDSRGNSSVSPSGDRVFWLARFDGTAWTVQDASTGLPDIQAIAAAPDGSIWGATPDGVVRFSGNTWATVIGGERIYGIAVAPDGTVWISGAFGTGRLAPSVAGN